jgi:prophage DNA circulation protein
MSNTPADFVASAQALAAAVLAATVDPADGIRLLSELANFTSDQPTASDAIGLAMFDMQDAAGDLFRRAAVVALARASAAYQPSSYDDAANVRTAVTALLDAEITIAGDQGEDASYNALRSLRTAVIEDLTTRGGSLAPISSFSLRAPLPALMLANVLYRDPARSDELVTQVDPIHPAFMPTQFRALSSPYALNNAAGAGAAAGSGGPGQLRWDQAGAQWNQPGQLWDQGPKSSAWDAPGAQWDQPNQVWGA